MSFGQRIKELRERAGLTREELASKIGVTYHALAKYETSERQPDFNTLAQIANFFKTTTDHILLGRQDTPSLPPEALEVGELYPVPIIGRITAGEPILTAENIEGYELLPREWLNGAPDNHYLLRVEGDSMEQARIFDGDKALIKKQSTFDTNGQICAVGILRETDEPYTTLKRVYELDDEYLELVPANNKYPRRKVHKSNVIIYGVLKKTIREEF